MELFFLFRKINNFSAFSSLLPSFVPFFFWKHQNFVFFFWCILPYEFIDFSCLLSSQSKASVSFGEARGVSERFIKIRAIDTRSKTALFLLRRVSVLNYFSRFITLNTNYMLHSTIDAYTKYITPTDNEPTNGIHMEEKKY